MCRSQGLSVFAGSFVFVSTVSCRQPPTLPAHPPAPAPASRAAKVYEALLDQALTAGKGKVVLERETARFDLSQVTYGFLFPGRSAPAPPHPEWAPKNGLHISKKVWKELSESFRSQNVQATELPLLDRPKLVTSALATAIHKASKGDSWPAFYKQFPGATGLLMLSRPGYSADGRVALVGFFIARGRKSAEQDLAVLELGASGWKVTDAFRIANA